MSLFRKRLTANEALDKLLEAVSPEGPVPADLPVDRTTEAEMDRVFIEQYHVALFAAMSALKVAKSDWAGHAKELFIVVSGRAMHDLAERGIGDEESRTEMTVVNRMETYTAAVEKLGESGPPEESVAEIGATFAYLLGAPDDEQLRALGSKTFLQALIAVMGVTAAYKV